MKHILLVCAALWPTLLLADIPRPDSLEDTLALQLEALQADPRILDPVIDTSDKSITFKAADGTGYTSYPDNLHKLLRAAQSDAERQTQFDDFMRNSIDGLFAIAQESQIDSANILPVIRETGFSNAAQDDQPVSRPLAGNLSVFLVEDTPSSLSYLRPSDLDALGLAPQDAFALAQTNRLARQWQPKIEGDGIYFLQLDGNFEASLLLDAALWDFVEEKIGPVLVTASNRDVVLFGPASDPEVRRVLTQLAKKYVAEGSYALSAQLMVRKDDGWVVSE